ncbi:metal-sensitive transcriptional regulator [Flexivirga caeni]|uniref:Transcriptional regulator n=1 Tax=Flexivirga caeni TaxID=2294115 RepID=A0A3M9MGD4_9MICO|nr:metal-sensitive transcriptional regulator [Flexivirga caeni]RNI24620.1 transcriptional regulator [Flexivirga caeni]
MELAPEEMKRIVVRMKRAHGHLGSVIRMIEEGAECEDVLTQLAAVNKALARSAFAIVATGLEQCLRDDDTDTVDRARLEKLFLALA